MMEKTKTENVRRFFILLALAASFVFPAEGGWALSEAYKGNIYNPGKLRPRDSRLKVAVGQKAPDFTLPAVGGGTVTLSSFRGRKNVMLTFIPAAWTPVCSDQWPGYNIVEDLFAKFDTVILGISVDNLPSLYAWTNQMGKLWFPVLSDFWPHGGAAKRYGLLRRDGMAERAIVIIDKGGVIRYLDVHDINERPPLEGIVKELEKLP